MRAGAAECGISAEDPIEQAVDHRGGKAVDQNGTGNREEFDSQTRHKTFGFEFDRRGRDRVGKARDRDQRSRAGEFGNVVKNREPGEQGGQKNQAHRGQGRRAVGGKPRSLPCGQKTLAQDSDRSAAEKGPQAVLQGFGLRRKPVCEGLVFGIGDLHANAS